ncbi:transferase hexapeptide (six repeat-containing protein) [Pseudobutyrivibrio sp. ACV-2]|uniref:acyltransferase n=1 Tax=Pseudobutyrivibrio sp. ACV-2 TaxID=1520801 RepID=UPI00089C4498|nr:acyltransferase [Pseudobutyrivibrio sp. ACV-2]SEA01017.1 transferase hexapeptide (six repeat-containing protein) [Pseudobutyrivibrio sp. ACV-2]
MFKLRELKKKGQHIFGFVRCLRSGIQYKKGIYIGNNVHTTNGKNIELGENVKIRPFCDIFGLKNMVIMDNCDIGTRNRIAGNVVIEKAVLIGPDNYICSYDHCFNDLSNPIMFQGTHSPKKNGHDHLRIGEGSWIGTHCAIIGDVHIGKHCVIGANSVVTKDIPDYCVAVGTPARIVKRLK